MFTRLLGRLGRLDKIAQYELGSVRFSVPLSRIAWDFRDVYDYEVKLVETFCYALTRLRNATLLDCGADIGTFSALVASRTDRIARVIALEPNVDTREFLQSNLKNLGIPSRLVPKAVSNFSGRGRLQSPQENLTDHARYLVPCEGPVEVTTVDHLEVRNDDVAIKIDIEGGELEALHGAKETISSARECVVALEASPAVAKRTGRDPVECLRFLQSIRPFHFVVAENGKSVSTSGPILENEQTEIWNVVASTAH